MVDSVLVDSVVDLRYVMISVIMVLVASEMTAAIPMNPDKSCEMSASHCCQHVTTWHYHTYACSQAWHVYSTITVMC